MKLNKKGSILQIVLIIFLVMSFSLTVCLSFIQFQSYHYQMISMLMKQKNLEIMLIHYYQSQMADDVLLSDDYESENEKISYVVENMGDYEEVETTVSIKQIKYRFIVWISHDYYEILKFEYLDII